MTNVGANLLKTPVGWAYQPNNETFVPLFALTNGYKNLVKIARHSEDDERVEMFEPSPAFVAFALAH